MLGREPNAIPFSTAALEANLLRLRNEWETVQPAGTGMRSMDTWPLFSKPSLGGHMRVGQLSALTGRCTYGGILRLGSRKRLPLSSFARPIQIRPITARKANGREYCGTPRKLKTWMSHCGFSSSARAVSTNVLRDLPGNLDGTDNAVSALLNTPNNIGQLAHLSTSNRAKPILKQALDGLGAAAPVGLKTGS